MKPVYRMSSAGACPRKLSAIRLGIPGKEAPRWLEEAAEEGKWHEERLVQWLREKGYWVGRQQEEVVIDQPMYTLFGHPDGVVTDNDKQKVLEIKSMSQFEFDRWMKAQFVGFPEYAAQLTCYMAALGLDSALYIVKNRNNGHIDIREINYPPDNIEKICQKIAHVEKLALENKCAEATYNPDSWECKRCDFVDSLGCIPEVVVTEQEATKLDEAVYLWRKAKELESEANDYFALAHKILESHTKATEQKTWLWDDVCIQRIIQEPGYTYDKKLLEKTFSPEQLEPVKKETKGKDYIKITDTRKED